MSRLERAKELINKVSLSAWFQAVKNSTQESWETLKSVVTTGKHAAKATLGAVKTVAFAAEAVVDLGVAAVDTANYAITRTAGQTPESDKIYAGAIQQYSKVGTDLGNAAVALKDTAYGLAGAGYGVGQTGLHFVYATGYGLKALAIAARTGDLRPRPAATVSLQA